MRLLGTDGKIVLWLEPSVQSCLLELEKADDGTIQRIHLHWKIN